MDTQVRTPQAIFMQPQRLLVPLFQRPYVWNEEQQWDPLWRDLERVATRMQKFPDRPQPHFLGAVVFQQEQTPTSDLQQRTVIDGQQRLTTLQLLLDALHAEILQVGAKIPAARLEPLIRNGDAFCQNPEDKFKVWPTNRDRQAFNEVMAAQSPIPYDALEHKASRLAKAHRFFSEQCREWLAKGDNPQAQAETIERSARELLQMVVIDLNANENAQEIFETLNARGAQLTAADLIKNFVFQRLLVSKADIESAYSKYWAQFETAFWEKEVSSGRVKQPRSSVFLNHWLIAKTGEEVLAREVFARFKVYADWRHEKTPMPLLLQEIHQAAEVYRKFVEAAEVREGPLDRVGLFAYRVKTLESEVVKPVLLALLDRKVPVPAAELDTALDVLESWLTRRMLVRGSTKAYNQIMAEVVRVLRQDSSNQPGRTMQAFFASQKADSLYWPDDEEVRRELAILPIYRKISRARVRMVLESIEDHRRGWIRGQTSAAGMRIRRDSYAIEHVMPQSWTKYWPPTTEATEAEREQRIHTMGNLTLLTKKLNSTVSNGPWKGKHGKAAHLQEKDVLLLNSSLLALSADGWDERKIDARTKTMIDDVITIWPVPKGHKSGALKREARVAIVAEIPDLLSAGYLTVGQTLYSGSPKHPGRTGTILSDGRIDVDGQVFESPSGAGHHIRQRVTNGWFFWLVDPSTKKYLGQVREEYRDTVAAGDGDAGDDESENRE